jgi:hypothetical protein
MIYVFQVSHTRVEISLDLSIEIGSFDSSHQVPELLDELHNPRQHSTALIGKHPQPVGSTQAVRVLL